MKRLINKILFGLTLTGGSLGLHSCGDWLDINSNELAATKTEAGYLFNYAAINYSSKRVGGDQWLPIIYAAQVASDADNWFVGADMYNISTYATGNGWVTSYSSCGYNLLKAIEFATGENDSNSVAQCKILLANTVWESSMLYGDIPYSEAWNIEGTQTPKFDTQKDVFYSVIGLLDEALDGIDESNSKRIDKYDIYYTGDMAKWRRLGNSLKLKFYMYLANKEDVGDEIKAIIDGGELMNSSADDFVFPFYTTPGNQNPNYQLTVQYPDYYEYCFFANPTVLDPMKALDDPRIPIYFRANADGEYISLEASEKGSVVTDKEISEKPSLCTEAVFQKNNLLRADYPDVICSYAETMFYVAEAYVRGLGVAKDLAQADAAYRKGIEASCVYNGVAAATAASFAAGVPSLSTLGGDDKALEDDDASARSVVEPAPHGVSRPGSSGVDPQLLPRHHAPLALPRTRGQRQRQRSARRRRLDQDVVRELTAATAGTRGRELYSLPRVFLCLSAIFPPRSGIVRREPHRPGRRRQTQGGRASHERFYRGQAKRSAFFLSVLAEKHYLRPRYSQRGALLSRLRLYPLNRIRVMPRPGRIINTAYPFSVL